MPSHYTPITAFELDPDRPKWERQPGETDDAWNAFTAYLRSEKRRVSEHGTSARRWAVEWAWSARTYDWDNHQIRAEMDLQLRSRVEMNERHRRIARASIAKVAGWLSTFDASKMSAAEATRLLDIAARLEREANGGTSLVVAPANPLEPDDDTPAVKEGTFEERTSAAALQVDLRDVARLLHHTFPLDVAPPKP